MSTYDRSPYIHFPLSLAPGAISDHFHYVSTFQILDNTGDEDLQVSFNKGPFYTLPAGVEVQLDAGEILQHIRIKNPGANTAKVNVAIGTAQIRDNRKTIKGTINSKSGDQVETPAAVSVDTNATLIIAADTDDTRRVLQNHGPSAVWIGDANVDPANSRGLLVLVGGDFPTSSGGAIYGRTVSGTATVSIWKEST